MMKRFICIFILIAVLALACFVRLFDLQIVKGDEYREQAQQRLVRAYPVKAPRGEIVDRYGEALVANRMSYYIQLQKVDVANDELNEAIYKLIGLVQTYGGEINTSFPIVYSEEKKVPEYDFKVDAGMIEIENDSGANVSSSELDGGEESEPSEEEKQAKNKEDEKRQQKKSENIQQAITDKQNELMTAWENKNKLTKFGTLKQIFEYYKNKYSIAAKYSDSDAMKIIASRYEMEQKSFGATNPFSFASDVDEIVVQQVKERSMEFPGVNIEVETVRAYPNGTMAAHILGRTGKIYAEEYAELKEKGYGMNDIIGKDGLEKVLESYLKGEDGYKSVEMSRGGGVTQILQNQPPRPGNYAMLTIDRDLQESMEESLQINITTAVNSSGAGAAIAVDPNTGGVLAMASYPSYDPEKFNAEYESLLKQKSNPLFNRALNGTYSPGSTFKMLSSIAGMESGVIDRYSTITDRGVYTYYKGYQPKCLIYSSSGATHGTINVSEAIGFSCNYFFYELGRLTTIEKLDEYCANFGLGKTTGIELQESTGRVAGPEEREALGGTWYPGDTLQAAIGQSDNLFTPAQLASYVCTFLNKGKRYGLHLLNQVVDYDTDQVVYQKEPEVLSDNPISQDTFEAVKDGMRRVIADGTAKAIFSNSKIQVGGKTGTAQVSDGADNVLFTGFAPYDNPEIVVAVVIEHGASSSYAAKIAKDVFDAYMQLKEERENPQPEEDQVNDRDGSAKDDGEDGQKTEEGEQIGEDEEDDTERGKTPAGTRKRDEVGSSPSASPKKDEDEE